MKILTRREAPIVAALAETMFPEGHAIVGAHRAKVVDAVDHFMSEVGPVERMMMRSMFALFEVGMGVMGPGRAFRFSRALPDHRRTYISSWESSDIYLKRLGFQALRSTFLIAYLQSGEVLEGIGVEEGEAALKRWQDRRARDGSGTRAAATDAEPVGVVSQEAGRNQPVRMRREAGRT